MDINKFYRTYLNKSELDRAALYEGQEFKSVKQLVKQRVADLENLDYLSQLVDGMGDTEKTLIKKLYKKEADNACYTVEYDSKRYPYLIDRQIIMKEKNGEGITHRVAVHALYQEIDKRTEEGGYWGQNLSALRRSVLQDLAKMDFHSLFSGFKINELKKIAKNLDYSPGGYSNSKEKYVLELTALLTSMEALTGILSKIDEEDYLKLKQHVQEEKTFFDVSGSGQKLMDLGIVLPVHNEYGILHSEVIDAIGQINFTELEARRRSMQNNQQMKDPQDDYNALKLRVTLMDAHVPIWREVVIPSRLNFYELHVVIQEAMGWQMRHLALFFAGRQEIGVYTLDEDMMFMDEEAPRPLLASYTQVDTILLETGEMLYLYDFGDNWEHRIELMEYIKMDKVTVPYVDAYEGPGPIEDVGGVDGFEEELKVIKDKSHSEHEETITWAKSLNYKGRYPKKSINRSLEEIFDKPRPLTEFNDPMIND